MGALGDDVGDNAVESHGCEGEGEYGKRAEEPCDEVLLLPIPADR